MPRFVPMAGAELPRTMAIPSVFVARPLALTCLAGTAGPALAEADTPTGAEPEKTFRVTDDLLLIPIRNGPKRPGHGLGPASDAEAGGVPFGPRNGAGMRLTA